MTRKKITPTVMAMSVFQHENLWTSFDDICCVGYAIHGDPSFVVFDLLQSVIITKFL